MVTQRYRNVAILDVDKTLVEDFLMTSFAQYLSEGGLLSRQYMQSMKHEEMDFRRRSRGIGEMDIQERISAYEAFIDRLVTTYGRGIEGKGEDNIDEKAKEYVRNGLDKKFPFTKRLIKTLKENSYRPVLVSGSPSHIVMALGSSLQIPEQDIHATTFEVKRGFYTGFTERKVTLTDTKKGIVESVFKAYHPTRTVGFGDSLLDIAPLRMVDNAFAVLPDKWLSEVADIHRWKICDERESLVEKVSKVLQKNE